MDLEDILILIVAAIGYIYTNYRKLQKQALERSKKLSIPAEVKPEQPKPVTITHSSASKKPREKLVSKTEAAPATYDERKEAEEFWKQMRNEISQPAYINSDVDKKNSYEADRESSRPYINIADEIHSGSVDWKKAVIYSEILRPVYF